MSEHPGPPDPSPLLGHGAWLRRLAGHLVRGGDGADDAVQETWLAALKARPSQVQDLRPWLGRVLLNNLRNQARTRSRRRMREEVVAGLAPQVTEPGDAAFERLQLQRQLAGLVSGLDEPFRTTVVLRYFEERSAAEIARQLGVPEGTVRWRCKEALDRLRAQLDERHGGDRKAWGLLLLPLALEERTLPRPSGLPPVVAAGGAALALLVAASAVVAFVSSGGGQGQGAEARRASPVAALVAPAGLPAGAGALDGVVLAPDGTPLPGAVVTARSLDLPERSGVAFTGEPPLPGAFTMAGPGGAFRLSELAAGRYVVVATHPQHPAVSRNEVELPGRRPLQLRLGGPAVLTLSGAVSDEGGGPIAGARVIVTGRSQTGFMAVTSASGAYRLVLPENASDVVALADGYAPARRTYRLDGSESVDLHLPPGARLSGRVLSGGRPVPGALVRLMPATIAGPRDHWERQTSTDAEGVFELRDLPAVGFRPFVRHGTLVVMQERPLLSLRAGAEEKVEFVLEAGVTVRGRVRDPGGRALPKARLSLLETDDAGGLATWGAIAEVTADDEGAFVFEGLSPARLQLRAALSGYAASRQALALGGQPVVEVDVALEARSGVFGVVYRADRTPAVGAHLRGSVRSGAGGVGAVAAGRADAGGRFEMSLDAGAVTLEAWLDREAVVHAPVSLRSGERKEVTVRLAPAAFVSGRVRWEDGRPAAGIRVRGYSARVNPQRGESLPHAIAIDPARTGADGSFTLGPFLPGRARVVAFARSELEPAVGAPGPHHAEARVAAGQHVTGLELVVSAGRQRIAGVAFGPDGQPLPGATLLAVHEQPGRPTYPGSGQGPSASSGDDGRFVIEALAEGTFTVFASHPEQAAIEVAAVRAGTSDLELRFPRPAQLTGAVTTRAGAPIAKYFLVVQPVVAPGGRLVEATDHPRFEVEESQGAFTVPRLLPVRYNVTATTADGLVAQARDVALEPGEVRRLELVAESGALLHGRVVEGATGAGAARVKVVTFLPGRRSVSATTDATGAFVLRGVPAGPKVRVLARPEDGARATAQVEVAVPRLGATVDLGTIRLQAPSPPPAGWR
jgi:RNA polymerase sigma-70 factor (ECF subfamily)